MSQFDEIDLEREPELWETIQRVTEIMNNTGDKIADEDI